MLLGEVGNDGLIPVSAFYAESIPTEGSENTELPGQAPESNKCTPHVTGIAPNILSQRLKRLEAEGIVIARPYQHKPLRLAYELTGAGSDLAGALRLLAHWGARGSDVAEPPRHSACGTPLAVKWYCPTCARVVKEEDDDLHRL
jgi:hypothetical protein